DRGGARRFRGRGGGPQGDGAREGRAFRLGDRVRARAGGRRLGPAGEPPGGGPRAREQIVPLVVVVLQEGACRRSAAGGTGGERAGRRIATRNQGGGPSVERAIEWGIQGGGTGG